METVVQSIQLLPNKIFAVKGDKYIGENYSKDRMLAGKYADGPEKIISS